MATSQNGYRANDISVTKIWRIPGTSRDIRLHDGVTGKVLVDLAAWFDKNIETIDHDGQLDDWGYAERTIRGSSTDLSNHASGTAMDLNATQHPLGARGTFSQQQTRAIRRKLLDYEGVIRWGGDYQNRADEMHFEINAGPAAVAAVARKLGDDDMQRNDELVLWDPVDGKQGTMPFGMTVNQARGYAEEAFRAAHRADVRTKRIEAAIKALAAGMSENIQTAVTNALEDATVEVEVNVAQGAE